MPPANAGYTFADFLQRLERSPVSHMSPLYHQHRLLFVNRPDMLSKAVLSVSWERGLALLQAAYYAQPVEKETYRALLARMLRHNRHVEASGAGQLVSWKAAMQVMKEAVVAHGTTLPTRVTVSTLRLLAPHRQWRTAIDLLKLSQANGQLTKPMLLDAAQSCATTSAWPHALRLLMHLHAQEPPLLHGAILSMRPPGTTALTATTAAQALLLPPPSARDGSAPTPAQQHVLAVLNSVVSSVPPEVALHHPLCASYLTHLLASTTLSPEVKVRRATAAMAQLPWTAALQLLGDLTEPSLLSDAEWSSAKEKVLLGDGATSATGGDARVASARSAKAKKASKKKRKAAASTAEKAASSSSVGADSAVVESAGDAAAAVTATTAALFARLQLLRASPVTAAAMIAVVVEKLPTPELAVAFLRSCATHLSRPDAQAAGQAETQFSSLSSSSSSSLSLSGSALATRHPVVVHALLRNCARHDGGWAIAADVLLEHSGAQVATPTELLSCVVQQLRKAKQVSLVLRLLHEHIVPSGSVLTAEAWEDVLECALAHNRALQVQRDEADAETKEGTFSRIHSNGRPRLLAGGSAAQLSGVHWVSALSWVLERQAASREERIQKTGTGPSTGATARRPTAHVRLEKPLTPKMLSLLINICVLGGSPQGALSAMGYARRVSKLELPHTAQIRALLYCMQYDRPFEAEAIVEQLARKEGEAAAQPLQHLLKLIGESKGEPESTLT